MALYKENWTERSCYTYISPGFLNKDINKSSKSTKVCLFRCAWYMRGLRKYVTVPCKVRKTYRHPERLPVRDSGADQKKSGRNHCWEGSCWGSFLIHVCSGKWQAPPSTHREKQNARCLTFIRHQILNRSCKRCIFTHVNEVGNVLNMLHNLKHVEDSFWKNV